MTLQSQRSYEEIVSLVITNIKKNLGEDLTLKIMADSVYLSPFYFNRIFRETTGLPPKEFLSALRMEKSKELLHNTNLRITDVCLEVGFNSLGTFTNRFHKYVGVSPKDYRKGNRTLEYSINKNPSKFATIRGIVNKEEESKECIMIGLFNKAIPQGKPISCTIIQDPLENEFNIKVNNNGTYYIFAVSGLYSNNILQGTSGPVEINNFEDENDVILNLRKPKEIDPPILINLPSNVDNFGNIE